MAWARSAPTDWSGGNNGGGGGCGVVAEVVVVPLRSKCRLARCRRVFRCRGWVEWSSLTVDCCCDTKDEGDNDDERYICRMSGIFGWYCSFNANNSAS